MGCECVDLKRLDDERVSFDVLLYGEECQTPTYSIHEHLMDMLNNIGQELLILIRFKMRR